MRPELAASKLWAGRRKSPKRERSGEGRWSFLTRAAASDSTITEVQFRVEANSRPAQRAEASMVEAGLETRTSRAKPPRT
ncbi:hypothetical protein V6N13_109481 [Hibiscus sabdariffa]